ncbi:MAG TPA: cytochrome c biogenesis protein CcsA [Bacteroidales bacterium]|nr:cytochrome c biogenesis protein CcsA [Bacteroidales bacterium]HQG36482.1 cytochrome c biogenesis protein CcsA [Bacteroidales bacterium]HQG52561.1 cytochrome c biogenesis protein CcsA [Bacteroidales bacterium]HQJ20481.1 cytochrome c biogenesis protein CcsA [Bacteroidales bacterium]
MKMLRFLFSPAFMGILFALFAVSMAAATFIENDFGRETAYKIVYGAKWFELIMLLLAINLVGQIFEHKLYRKEKITVMMFHLAFIIILAGAALTRYTGFEGAMHIREGEYSNQIYSAEKYIRYSVKDKEGRVINEKYEKFLTSFLSPGGYERFIKDGEREYRILLIPDMSHNAFVFHVFSGNETRTVSLSVSEDEYISSGTVEIGDRTIELSYGSKIIALPFSLKLNDFILERYPGSNTPSGYKSDIVLEDHEAGVVKPFMIFMNNVLKYKGYRFYQASYDQDEKGTILSVNHDPAGMYVTYTGYGLLFLFIILSLINPNSLFKKASIRLWKSPFGKNLAVFSLILILSGFNYADAQKFVPDKKVSEEFGKVLVQDQKGRTEPLYTLSYDIVRKVTKQNKFQGLSPMQVFLGIYTDFEHWQNEPLIKISDKELRKKTGATGKMASFSDIVDFSKNGYYKIASDVQKAYSKAPGERDKYDKEIIKTDEKINILYMIYTGEFLRIFPLNDSLGSWGNWDEALQRAVSHEDSVFVENIYTLFASSLYNGNISGMKQVVQTITTYQRKHAGYELPAETKIAAELFYHKAEIFERLFPLYAVVGLFTLVWLIVVIIRGAGENKFVDHAVLWVLVAGFAAHTAGIGLRWYISGHAPLSNGYETMIFISWVTMLAGFIFRKKSGFVLPATSFLSAMTLMVAHMSYMDPEITNLVPVLKSYWLTLHVSVITSSYAFLGLGTILSFIIMILLSFSDRGNINSIGNAVETLTVINFKTLIIGLYLLTIGTFLGAVWANESWGRYWGWDPKETWSLITIIVYSFVIHSRMIPSLRNIYAFNLLSLFAISSVLMTYFGVNYYLSGLHSYAGGDSLPVPAFLYIGVAVLVALSVIAYIKYRKWCTVARGEVETKE